MKESEPQPKFLGINMPRSKFLRSMVKVGFVAGTGTLILAAL